MAGQFEAQVGAWAAKTERQLAAVVHEASLGAADAMTRPRGAGGHMPVVSGNLRNSLAASLSGPPPIDWTRNHKFSDLSGVGNVVKAAEPGHTIFLGFRAPYAEKVEFGESGGFWRLTIQRWQSIVVQAVRRVKGGS